MLAPWMGGKLQKVVASPDSDSDSMGESESGLRLYPCGLRLGLKRCGRGLWSQGLGLGLHPGELGLTVSLVKNSQGKFKLFLCNNRLNKGRTT